MKFLSKDSTAAAAAGSAFEPSYVFKILLIGDSGTGKSSILLRFTDDIFEGEDRHEATIGVDFKMKFAEIERISIDGDSGQEPKNVLVKLNIWDTAGQERFRTLTSSYYRGAQGVILMYDVTNRESFENLNSWFKEIKTYEPDPPSHWITMIVGNKIDKEDERVVSKDEGLDYARREGSLFLECSAKSSVNVEKAFGEMLQKIVDGIEAFGSDPGAPNSSSGIKLFGSSSFSSLSDCVC